MLNQFNLIELSLHLINMMSTQNFGPIPKKMTWGSYNKVMICPHFDFLRWKHYAFLS